MSKTITREFYSAAEVHIEEFSTEAIHDEALARGMQLAHEGDLVIPSHVLYQWGRMCMAGQTAEMAEEAVAMVKEAARRIA